MNTHANTLENTDQTQDSIPEGQRREQMHREQILQQRWLFRGVAYLILLANTLFMAGSQLIAAINLLALTRTQLIESTLSSSTSVPAYVLSWGNYLRVADMHLFAALGWFGVSVSMAVLLFRWGAKIRSKLIRAMLTTFSVCIFFIAGLVAVAMHVELYSTYALVEHTSSSSHSLPNQDLPSQQG